MSAEVCARIARKSLHSKIVPAKECVKFFKDGMAIGWSGFTPAGYPKAVPIAVSEHVEANKLQGKMRFSLFAGASTGADAENRWAKNGLLAQRFPYQTGKDIQAGINTNKINFSDLHLHEFPGLIKAGFLTKDGPQKGKLDLAVIEATEILADGSIVLATSVGAAPEICDAADKIIIEVNTRIPSLKGLHDIVPNPNPPLRQPILINRVDDRAGSVSIPIDPDKIIAIVESKYPDRGRSLAAPDKVSATIASHIIEFFSNEVKHGRLPKNLLPLQSGVGSIANAVTAGLVKAPFEHLTVWTEVLQDTFLDLFDSGKLDYASATSLSLSEKGFERFWKSPEKYLPKIILRPQSISNHPEFIRRMGIIAMNTPVEVDMYAHANSTMVNGTRMVNGIGGSGDFLRNGFISMMHTPSARKTKKDPTGISCIVPKVTHVDHTEHDLDCIVTEQGLADVRGLCPKARAKLIIEKCAHPDYKEQLNHYLELATAICTKKKAAHEPQILGIVYEMHNRLEKKGSMKMTPKEIDDAYAAYMKRL